MKDHRDQKLDALLRSRPIEPPSSDLAQRIIFKARQLPQRRMLSPWQWIGQLCSEFHLPRPAYVIASTLVLGMLIGFSLPSDAGPGVDEGVASVQGFLSTDEAIL